MADSGMEKMIERPKMSHAYDEKYFEGLNRYSFWGNNQYREAQRLHTLGALCQPQRDDDVLELGCGTGHYTRFLACRVRRIVGVDFSEAAIIKARSEKNAENIQYITADIQNLELFPLGSFQKIVAVDVLEHLTNAQLANALSEVDRLLDPQGLFILFTPCRTHWIERLKGRNILLKQTTGHVGVRSEQEIRRYIGRSGLQVEEVIRFETCIPLLRLLERQCKKLPVIGNLFVSRLGMSASKTAPGVKG